MTLTKIIVISLLCCLCNLMQAESGSEAEIIKALEETEREEVSWKHIPLSGPSFDKDFAQNITIQIGKTAILNCRIKYLGGKTVSWMRVRDLHLLTVGRFTYTSDERFKAVHTTASDDWLLKIHYAQTRDAGAYACQVSTTPPISITVWLNVVAEPETEVLGGPDLFINSGSTINLTCVVYHRPEPPSNIYWYHQSEQLSYDSPRGGITVVTEHGPTSSSRLLIQRATDKDAGEYTCRPANAEPHYINVHIFPNEHPAAIHHKNGTSGSLSIHIGSQSSCSFILNIILFLLIIWPNLYLLGSCFSDIQTLKTMTTKSRGNFKCFLAHDCTRDAKEQKHVISRKEEDKKNYVIIYECFIESHKVKPVSTREGRNDTLVIFVCDYFTKTKKACMVVARKDGGNPNTVCGCTDYNKKDYIVIKR